MCFKTRQTDKANHQIVVYRRILTQEQQDSGECTGPLGHPEFAEDEVDGGRDERAAEGGQQPQREHGHVVAVLHTDLLELKLQ